MGIRRSLSKCHSALNPLMLTDVSNDNFKVVGLDRLELSTCRL